MKKIIAISIIVIFLVVIFLIWYKNKPKEVKKVPISENEFFMRPCESDYKPFNGGFAGGFIYQDSKGLCNPS